ncbi:Xylosidase/arabinosidase like protein [Verticillium longisporum]|nr:Xylosidase/arabinosidase like protein [Verticillium longisporum]
MGPRVAKLTDDMHQFAGEVQEIQILDPDTGKPILGDDHDRRFFEAAWVHKRNGTYYFSYSTGDSHYLCYATGDSPLGPFTYGGRILEPVLGWTTHHSIVEFKGQWWLFHHDCELSKGVDHLRSVKVKEIFYTKDGKIVTEKPQDPEPNLSKSRLDVSDVLENDSLRRPPDIHLLGEHKGIPPQDFRALDDKYLPWRHELGADYAPPQGTQRRQRPLVVLGQAGGGGGVPLVGQSVLESLPYAPAGLKAGGVRAVALEGERHRLKVMQDAEREVRAGDIVPGGP